VFLLHSVINHSGRHRTKVSACRRFQCLRKMLFKDLALINFTTWIISFNRISKSFYSLPKTKLSIFKAQEIFTCGLNSFTLSKSLAWSKCCWCTVRAQTEKLIPCQIFFIEKQFYYSKNGSQWSAKQKLFFHFSHPWIALTGYELCIVTHINCRTGTVQTITSSAKQTLV
jgi:hypothetical protein